LIREPFRNSRISDHSPYESYNRAAAFWQMRILNLPGCLARTHLPGIKLRFNVILDDPIASLLPSTQPWRGTGGEFIVTLGETCDSQPGQDPSLPVLMTTVNAFTRLWLGVRPASGLALTDTLAGSPELLKALDWAFRLPTPVIDWAY
jgi:hypothetical protein